ncbi:MAG: hypothetical protein N3A53_07095 [Verrucomicrobiae bacterium]|nr:hypothetical protein [Verrucomicrobiae bacterium]
MGFVVLGRDETGMGIHIEDFLQGRITRGRCASASSAFAWLVGLRYLGIIASFTLAGFGSVGTNDAVAATRTKAGSGTTLTVNSAWVGGVQPDGTDTALWNNTSTTGSHTLGGNLTWGEIEIANPSADITFASTGGFTLTLNGVGGVGIDLGSATRNLTINATLALGASQEWNVGASRTLSVATVNGSGNTITKTGAGTLTLLHTVPRPIQGNFYAKDGKHRGNDVFMRSTAIPIGAGL